MLREYRKPKWRNKQPVQSGETAGEIVLTAKASGVKAGNIRIQTK